MLKFDNVSFQYDVEDFSIIDHLSFDVQDGEFVSVIGASGCGKSTIFRLVNKLLPGGRRVHREEEKLLRIHAAAGSFISMADCEGESPAADGDPGRIFENGDERESGRGAGIGWS